MHLLLRVTFLAHPGVTQRYPPPCRLQRPELSACAAVAQPERLQRLLPCLAHLPLALAAVVQPRTEHVAPFVRGAGDIAKGWHERGLELGRVAVFYSC